MNTANWSQLNPATPYIWNRLVYHHIQAGEWEALYGLLTDFDYLEARTRATSVFELEGDYQEALKGWQGNSEHPSVLSAFEERLRLEGHHYHRAPELLVPQLINHLIWRDAESDGPLYNLCEQEMHQRKNWLRMTQDPRPEPPLWLRSLEGHTNRVTAVALTPDGTQIVSGSTDKTLKVWNLASGRLLRSLEGHTGAVNAVALSPDGTQIISGSTDNTLKVWDLASGRLLHSLQGHTDTVSAIALTPNGTHIVSGSWDKTLKLWNLASGRLLRSLEGHTDAVSTVAIARDGKHIVSGSHDNTFKFWEFNTGKSQTPFWNDSAIYSLALSSDTRWVVCGDEQGRVWIFEWMK